MKSEGMKFIGGGRLRTVLRAALSATVLSGALVGLSSVSSSAVTVTQTGPDVGVSLTGPSTVAPGGTLALNADLYNDGAIPTLSATMTVNVANGGTVTSVSDGANACSVTSSTQVTCSYGSVASGQNEPAATISVSAPTSTATITSTASESALFTVGDDDTVPLGTDSDETATVSTQVQTSDVGVSLNGPLTAVTNGDDALLQADLFNDGTASQASAVLTVATGGKVDSNLALPSNCSVATGTTDTVNCSYSNVAGGTTEPTVNIAVKTPSSGSSMTSTASETATLADNVSPDTDETATFVTSLSPDAPCGTSCTQAFLPNGSPPLTRTSPDGFITNSTQAPAAGSTWDGGGMNVTLDEVNNSNGAITCGGSPCTSEILESKFQPLASTGTPDPNTPLTIAVTYNMKQSCAGKGGPAGCLPLYYLTTGQYSGAAASVPLCSNYSPNNTTPLASSDPCIYGVQKNQAGVITYLVAALKDLSLPIP